MHTQNTMPHDFQDYIYYLQSEERSPGTIANNLRHLRAFAAWLDGEPVDKVSVSRWEYQKLLRAARARGWRRIALVVETIGATGIRVSELSAITAESVARGRTDIHLKGKIRTILIPSKLCKKLTHYARLKKIAHGEIFLNADGKPMTRYQVWAEMKNLAKEAGVAPSKVFPHNLRHLFATVFYETFHDIARLADMLGHSSIETTRIYLAAPGSVCCRQLESLQLVE